MKSNIIIRIFIMLGLYFGIRYYGGDLGKKILYPIQMLATFLHEFGHAVGAIITGGEVRNIQINQDGSGFTRTVGGSKKVILMGGYLGSALFGNLIFLIGARAKFLAKPLTLLLAITMFFTGIFWFNSLFTTGLLFGFGIILVLIAIKTKFAKDVLMFLGLSTLLFIIQDFNIGPTSDLEKYAEEMKILPADAWMYIWLVVVIALFLLNLRILFKSMKNEEDDPMLSSVGEDEFLTID